jgi:peptide/nickel transport system permease protein
LTEPTEEAENIKGYVFTYDLDADKFPTGVIFKYMNLTFYGDLPAISLKVKRPD